MPDDVLPAALPPTPRAVAEEESGRTSFRQRVFRTRADDTLPMRIAHERIYILPTRRGWAFLAALLLMLVASVNYSLSLGYALSFLLTGLFAATLLHTYRNIAGVDLGAVGAGDAFAGEALPFTATLGEQAGRTRYGIELRNATAFVTFDIPALDKTRPALEVPTDRRGYLSLGRLTLSSDWPLGLWRAWSYVHAPVTALVWPAPERDAPPLPQTRGAAGSGRRTASSDGDVAGLRAYEPGDAPSRIAWKSAARGTGLKVRLLDDETGSARTELSFEATRLGIGEVRLSRLAAWVLEAERQGLNWELKLPGALAGSSTDPATRAGRSPDARSGELPDDRADDGPASRRSHRDAALAALGAWA